MFGIMGGSHTPKQGDHVFNAVNDVLMLPFESLSGLQVPPPADGSRFVQIYLLHSADRIRRIADNEGLSAARKLSASQGAEEDALRVLAGLSDRRPALRRVNPGLLRKVHLENASQFGSAALRYELEVLGAVRSSIEGLLGGAAAPAGLGTKAGLAFQELLNHAYDPGSALVMIAKTMQNENPGVQGTFLGLIESIADKLERPAMWRDPFIAFSEANTRQSETARIVEIIAEGLRQLQYLKVPGFSLDSSIREEIKQIARGLPLPPNEASALLYGLQNRIQTLRAGN